MKNVRRGTKIIASLRRYYPDQVVRDSAKPAHLSNSAPSELNI